MIAELKLLHRAFESYCLREKIADAQHLARGVVGHEFRYLDPEIQKLWRAFRSGTAMGIAVCKTVFPEIKDKMASMGGTHGG